MSAKVIDFPGHVKAADARKEIAGVAGRLSAGTSVAVAIIEVNRDGNVSTVWFDESNGGVAHHLTSGASHLAARLTRPL
jgi:hypothetical protein